MFNNGLQHEKQKLFLMKICEVARTSKVLPVATKVIPEYLKKWNNAGLSYTIVERTVWDIPLFSELFFCLQSPWLMFGKYFSSSLWQTIKKAPELTHCTRNLTIQGRHIQSLM